MTGGVESGCGRYNLLLGELHLDVQTTLRLISRHKITRRFSVAAMRRCMAPWVTPPLSRSTISNSAIEAACGHIATRPERSLPEGAHPQAQQMATEAVGVRPAVIAHRSRLDSMNIDGFATSYGKAMTLRI